jgi:preprotein translocase subunit YajC
MSALAAFFPLLAQAQQPSPMQPIIMIGLFMIAMYFFMIAPQRKKDKAHKAMLAALKNGDKVVTVGGIYGTVTAVKEDRIHIKVDESTRLEMLKTSIQSLQPSSEAKKS